MQVASDRDALNVDIVIMNPDGSDPTPYLQAPWRELFGKVNPDGMWLAYVSDQTGDSQILLRSFPTPGEALTLATDVPEFTGGIWGPEGRMFYYPSADSLYAVELEFEPEPRVVSRRALFSLRTSEGLLALQGVTGSFSFHPERGFVMALIEDVDASGAPSDPPRVYLVVNWFRELRELVGGN